MAKSFLDIVVENVLLKSEDFNKLILVLPSQRAGVFLKKKLINALEGKTSILPQILSIETFIQELSGLDDIDNESLLLLFYKAYLEINTETEKKDFESFLSWGQTLLGDFNEIDRYLVDHKQFFNYLSYIKDQEHWFLQENKTELIENYIQFWHQLELYYKELVEILLEKKIGFQGLQYRKASENIKELGEKTSDEYIFIGFNALNEAEQNIFKSLERYNKATFIWDADKYFVQDKIHDASYFLRKHIRTWNNVNLLKENTHQSFSSKKNIYISGIPKNIGQVKYIGNLLSKFDQDQISKTAVVLADEALLTPLLNSLPGNVKNVNITMGQPLAYMPISNFITQLFTLKQSEKNKRFYYKNVISILNHSASEVLLENSFKFLIALITDNNFVYLDKKTFKNIVDDSTFEILNKLLNPWVDNLQCIEDIEFIVLKLIDKYSSNNDYEQVYYLEKFIAILEELRFLVTDHSYVFSIKTLIQFYNLKLNSETIDFRGEPFEGLQIMGVLESRCLDFETVIIASVNEGILPSAQKGNSFIPYDLKIESKLPTYKEKDAIYAYHFYRLLQRCDTAYLTYNTEVDELNSGEKSRFLKQIELEPHPNHTIISKVVSMDSSINYTPITSISKEKTVIEKLKNLMENGISPSALNTYLRNGITFYDRYILGVQEASEVEEEIAANTLGTIIHNVLETFYKPLEGKILLIEDIKKMLKRIDGEVANEFAKEYTQIQITNGINFLSFEASKQFIKKFLLQEIELLKSGNEIQIVSVEKKYKTKLIIPELDFPVYIKGMVDRVDRLNGKLRIIDYKTGHVDPFKLKISDWEIIRKEQEYGKALQVLIYAYMYCSENKIKEPVEGGIISFKKLNSGFLSFALKEGRKLDTEINSKVFDSFLEQLKLLIIEICNINIPFEKNESEDI